MKKALLLSLAFSLAVAASALGEGVDDAVRGSVTVDFASKVLSYGLPDADRPNLLPSGDLTFFDCLSVGAKFYIDLTDIGTRMGRGDRTWDFWETDFSSGLRHAFTPDEVGWLPTSVEVGVGYLYEYHPPRTHIRDTQFWLADVSLPDLWLVPCLSYERDVIRDNGTYLNLSLSKEVEVGGGVSLTPSVSQGWGDRKRVGGYLSAPDLVGRLERAALMDTRVGLSLVWRLTDCLTLSGFVAYSDFLFDRHVHEAARNYIRQSDGGARNRSWSFPCGVSLSFAF